MRYQRAHRRGFGNLGKGFTAHFSNSKFTREQAHGSAFNVAFNACDLTYKPDIGFGFQTHFTIKQRRRVDKTIAVDPPKPCEFGVFERRNCFKNSFLRAVLHLCLESDDVVKRPQ